MNLASERAAYDNTVVAMQHAQQQTNMTAQQEAKMKLDVCKLDSQMLADSCENEKIMSKRQAHLLNTVFLPVYYTTALRAWLLTAILYV